MGGSWSSSPCPGTLVGGSAELIKAIVGSLEFEAWQVKPTDSLAFEADKINGGPGR